MASARSIALAALAVGVLAVLAVLHLSGGGGGHGLRASFTAGLQVFPGGDVKVADRKVGSVRSVGLQDGHAVLDLQIDDSQWPLHRGTVARLRAGAPAGYAQRFVELYPGPTGQPAIPDGAVLSTSDTVTPVEAEQLSRMFGVKQRRAFGEFLANTRATLDGAAPAIRSAVSGAATGLPQVDGLLSDLDSSRGSLSQLTSSAALTFGTLRAHQERLQQLVSQAAGTFDELADHSAGIRATLDHLPSGLASAQDLFKRTDHTLGVLQPTVDALGPGAVGLRQLAPSALHVLQTLQTVAPQLTRTLQAGSKQSPTISRFLDHTGTLVPALSSALGQLAPIAGCLLPYGPEIGGTLVEGASAFGNYDALGHYVRDNSFKGAVVIGTPQNSKQSVQTLSGRLKYAFPRPPGYNAGKPRYDASCGITPDALNPAKDPEARR